MIGSNIKAYPALFTRAFEELDLDIAVHTWTHRHMPTLSNLELVGEFGWTMEIIRNSTVSVPCAFADHRTGSLIGVIPRAVGCRDTGDHHMAMPIIA